jgi:PiT family inorganic phosphate transporter
VTKLRGIRWGLATRIIWAWVFTIPLSGLVGAACLAIARALNAW